MDGELLVEQRGSARWLTLNRPSARNALSAELLVDLGEALAKADLDPAARVVVITGAGDKAFCAGGSLALPDDSGFLGSHDGRRLYGQTLLKLQQCSKPVIASVNGYALAGGMGLVLGCDLAVVADDAKLGLPEIDIGLFPYQVIAVLIRHLGRKQALELCLTGRKLTAQEALGLGLVNRVVARAELATATEAFAEQLAGKSAAILKLGKRSFYAAEDAPLPVAMELLAGSLSLNTQFEDAAEGISAFLEKRPPAWKGK